MCIDHRPTKYSGADRPQPNGRFSRQLVYGLRWSLPATASWQPSLPSRFAGTSREQIVYMDVSSQLGLGGRCVILERANLEGGWRCQNYSVTRTSSRP